MTLLGRVAPRTAAAVLTTDRPAPPAPSPADRAVRADAFLTQAFTDCGAAGTPFWRHAVRRPALLARTARALAQLQPLAVELPQSDETEAVARMLRAHPGSRRAMLGVAAVVRTPDAPGTYADGPERATLRRKMRAATKQGITIRHVPAQDRPALVALARRHEQQNEREAYRSAAPLVDDLLQYDLWLAAYDADHRPVMLAVIPRCGEWAVLRYFRTLVGGQASSDARYLMTDAVAETLAGLGVRHLVDSARPHWLPNGLRHFQRMVGFRLVRLRSIRVQRG